MIHILTKIQTVDGKPVVEVEAVPGLGSKDEKHVANEILRDLDITLSALIDYKRIDTYKMSHIEV